MTLLRLALATAALLVPVAAFADPLQVEIRGHPFTLPRAPAQNDGQRAAVLFLPGDGGLHGFAFTIANRMSDAGYQVYSLDTREYLEAFTQAPALSVGRIGQDLQDMAYAIQARSHLRVILVGWSEGAALAVAAAALDPGAFCGVVTFGLPERAALGWRLRDSLASLAGREPDEPEFDVAPLLSRLQAIPMALIQATHDPFTSMDRARALFGRVTGPKRLRFIEARNHRFDGGTSEFFAALDDSLDWVVTTGRQLVVRAAARGDSQR